MLQSILNKMRAYFHGPENWSKAVLYTTGTATFWYYGLKYTREPLHPPLGQIFDDGCKPPDMKWPPHNRFQAMDFASVRRGYQVYREICSNCHSLKNISFFRLVGTTHTMEQAKALAASVEVDGGLDKHGNSFKRPGSLTDKFPSPYKNDKEAEYANGGLLPPDLSEIIHYHNHHQNYYFALLNGYNEPPPGEPMVEGKHWNNYFPGGWIGMPNPLPADDMVDYEDGTKATRVQMAWDVVNFLRWTANPEKEHNRMRTPTAIAVISCICLALGYMSRSQKLIYKSRLFYHKPKAKF